MVLVLPSVANSSVPLNRGASWLELAIDFVSSTGVRHIGAAHSSSTPLEDVASAFASLSLLVEKEAKPGLFLGVRSRVTSLDPFGIRNAFAASLLPHLSSPSEVPSLSCPLPSPSSLPAS